MIDARGSENGDLEVPLEHSLGGRRRWRSAPGPLRGGRGDREPTAIAGRWDYRKRRGDVLQGLPFGVYPEVPGNDPAGQHHRGPDEVANRQWPRVGALADEMPKM